MARTKEFDPDVAVADAIEIFWDRGYANTSMQDLVDRLGLNRGSIYDTFGSKHDLFVAALTKYCRDAPAALLEVLADEGPLKPRLREALVALIDFDLGAPLRRGCLLLNSAMENLPGDADTAELFERTTTTMKVAFESALRRAQLDGELSKGIKPKDGAAFLLATLQGLRVLAKGGAERRTLVSTIDIALHALA